MPEESAGACTQPPAEMVQPSASCGLTPENSDSNESSVAAAATIESPRATAQTDKYQDALNTAASARSIGDSALSQEDWALVADQWQAAITLLKSIPKSSSNYKLAAQILPQYQQNLANARQKSVNFKAKAVPGQAPIPPAALETGVAVDRSRSFTIPIIKKLDGVPIIEVTINGQERFQMMLDTGASKTLLTKGAKQKLALQAIGSTAASTANGKANFETVALDSIQFGAGVTSNLSVAVANDNMSYGLLGHDVYQGYDITLREDTVLFEKR